MKRILIIDDDIVIRKMIIDLIEKHKLGQVVGELDSGKHAVEEIEFLHPDIVIVDLLLPEHDGIHIVKTSVQTGFQGKFIMISQVEDESMISKAYEAGCIFFLNKPVNAIEAVSVMKTVINTLDLERSFELIRSTVIGMPAQSPKKDSVQDVDTQIDNIFSDLGIISESGADDLKSIILKIVKQRASRSSSGYKLQDLYATLSNEKALISNKSINARSIEQRIRRVILKAMTTLAEIGRDDFENIKFSDYASVLFDLSQIRQEIRFIENKSSDRGKISVKRFIEGIMSKIDY